MDILNKVPEPMELQTTVQKQIDYLGCDGPKREGLADFGIVKIVNVSDTFSTTT